IAVRRGRAGFRRLLRAAYSDRCAVTGCDYEGALEAAHIIPYLGPATNHLSNGLLLRADIHTLFDLGDIWVDPTTFEVRIDDRLKGTDYEQLSGKKISLPNDKNAWPSVEALRARNRKLGENS